MMNTLQQVAARAVASVEETHPHIDTQGLDWEDCYVVGNAVLAALGLDDLDAAARRAARALWDREQASEAAAQQAEYGNDAGATVEPEPFNDDDPRCDWYFLESRRVLEAALTATDAKGSSDAQD